MAAATIASEAPEDRSTAVRRGAELLRAGGGGGGLVVFPTETVYGIGASAASETGIERLRRLKQRAADKPFTIHLPGPEAVSRYVDLDARPNLRRLVRKTMPGPITIVVDVEDEVIERKLAELGLPPEARGRLYHGNTIGLRCPDHPVAAALLGAVDEPIVASSANPAGSPPPANAQRAAQLLGEGPGGADLVIDGGPCRFAKASTVVRVREGKMGGVEVLREGVYDQRYLDKLMNRLILFVCSGNTCRSPMAEAIARHELSQRLSVPPDRLREANVSVLSAGAHAMPGAAAAPESAHALKELGIPAPRHSSRALTLEMVREADVIYCMTPTHMEALAALAPAAREKARLLDPEGRAVDDPLGSGPDVYVSCARRMRDMIRRRLDEAGLTGERAHPPHDPPTRSERP